MGNKNKTVLSEQLRHLRRSADLTQAQVAEALGIERSTWTYYEQGTVPKLAILEKIAALFRVPLTDLIQSSGKETEVSSDPEFEKSNQTASFQQLTDDEKKLILQFRTASKEAKDAAISILKNKKS